jgi:hypothetical protein
VSTIFRDKVTIVNGGTVTYNDVTVYPPGATYFNVDRMDGWDDTSDLEGSVIPRGNIDGDVPPDFTPARSRHLLVEGYLLAPTRAQADGLFDQVVLSMPRNRELVLSRYEAVPKFLRARRMVSLDVLERYHDPNGAGHGMRWQTQLVAPDPFKYDVNTQSNTAGVSGAVSGGRTYPRSYPMVYTVPSGTGNAILLNNTGTAPTLPLITLTGPLPRGNWRVANDTTLKTFSMDMALISGDTLVLDFRKETAVLNGYPVFATTSGDFWSVERGTNTIRLYADFDPAASITAAINSAWE